MLKFGGTSVATPERIRAAARRLAEAHESGARVVGVLSAMGHATDELLGLAHAVSPDPVPRELDMLVTTGERVSCALCAMALHDLGHDAVSLTGSQAGIHTEPSHGGAEIVALRTGRVQAVLDEGRIVLVAGFQGVSTEHEVTTLGRGGSDLTAVALAAALGALTCEIYTDVDGVYSADPRHDPTAQRYDRLSFARMEALAAAGAQVLQLRSVQAARARGVRLHVRSAFDDAGGTWITEEEDETMPSTAPQSAHAAGRAV